MFYLSYVDDILVACRCIQRNFLMFSFMNKCFLKYLWQRETYVSIFEKKKMLTKSTVFINKPPSFLEVVDLIFSFKNIFQRNENRFISLVLKAKQQKGIQLPYIFLKFYASQFSNQLLLFLHFPGLIVIYVESSSHVIPCLT